MTKAITSVRQTVRQALQSRLVRLAGAAALTIGLAGCYYPGYDYGYGYGYGGYAGYSAPAYADWAYPVGIFGVGWGWGPGWYGGWGWRGGWWRGQPGWWGWHGYWRGGAWHGGWHGAAGHVGVWHGSAWHAGRR